MIKRILLLLFIFVCYSIAFSADEAIHTGALKMTGDMYLNGSASFTGASWLYQSDPDSTTAFQILDSGGSAVLNVDTLNGRVGINNPAPDERLHINSSGASIHLESSSDADSDFIFDIDAGATQSIWTIRHSKSFGANPLGLEFIHDTVGIVMVLDTDGILISHSGRTINETIYTTTDNILTTDDLVWGDTDGGAFVLTIHDGSGGQRHTVTNSGGSGNALTITADGTDTIDGGASLVLYDGETAIICFNSTDNEWRP